MSTVITSYSETNSSGGARIGYSPFATNIGETFIPNKGTYTLTSCSFYIIKNGSPTGNAVANIYETTGTYHTTGCKPTGSALATSDNFDVSTMSAISYNLYEFTFSGVNQIKLNQNKVYAVAIYYDTAVSPNALLIGTKSAPTNDPANRIYSSDSGSTWSAYTNTATCYYVYGDLIPTGGFFSFMNKI